MLRTTLAGLRAHKLRLLLTAVAITLGVGFIAGTFVLTDTLDRGIQRDFAQSAGKVDAAVLPPDENSEEGLPASLLASVRAVPSVTDAQGILRGNAPLVGRDGKVVGDVPTLGESVTGGRLQRHELDRGRVPSGPGEAVIDARLAKREGFAVGDTITVLDPGERPRRFALVGLIDLGLDADASNRGVVGFDPATAARMTGETTYREIDVVGATPAAVKRAVGPAGEVLSGSALADRLAKTAGADTTVIRAGLLLFALVAMLVSAVVIYNTFAILVAQRTREMTLLRCVGATRRQIFGGVVLEAFVVGLVGSLLGLAAGLGLGAGTLLLLNSFESIGPGIPVGDVTLTPLAVVVGLAVGVIVTVLSALLPARAATRVAPVAALRSEPEPGSARFRLGWPRLVVALPPGGIGAAGALYGALSMDKGASAMYLVALSGGLVFIAVVALMPALIRPLGRLVGAPPAWATGVPGRLAVENARRSPKRTATTTIALTIGVGLISLFAVIAASGKAQADQQLAEQFPVDFQIQPQLSTGSRMPHALAEALRTRPELSAVIEQRGINARVGDREARVITFTEGALGGVIKPVFESGSVRALRSGTALVDAGTAKARGLRTGGTVTITPRRGPGARFTVAGIYESGTPFGGLVLTGADFDRTFEVADPSRIFVKADPSIPADRARIAVDDAARPYPTARVISQAELREEFIGAVDNILMIFGGLLGLAIVIALFGIANTLTLSVVERTRESALLRALGLTRRQLRRMLSVEAVVMAVIGALTGVVLGVAFGWAATRAMAESAVFALPFSQIAGFTALAGVAGVLAAVLPARRAARASIVQSLSYD
ncbi:ABC transporter substrate-binding protein [Actinomadura sp. NBRC 104412]|uniref:ABC transporter permease n=1 Tax=Actinomadura sp. NBRC 104412 TaxID=3032203 RepID=UPI0024A02AA1|nr:FtsX-like permease family protein [Actinomadura sp. NBRC 104412]GLZ06353.1 ABC transporter substrate-binding protein [Actinomadura sp. NBRC 104412]